MANGHGGKRDNSGRKKAASTTEEWSGPQFPEGKNIRPLDFWLAIMRDDNAPFDMRMRAAQEAMPFVHGKPSSKEPDQRDLGDVEGAGDSWTHDLNPAADQKGLH